MFLLKPLKELRAKRKGTHSCLCACVCVFQQLRFDVFIFFARVILTDKVGTLRYFDHFLAGLFACFAAVC